MSLRPRPQPNHVSLGEFVKLAVPTQMTEEQMIAELQARGYRVTKIT